MKNIIFLIVSVLLIFSCNINTQDSNQNNPLVVDMQFDAGNNTYIDYTVVFPEVYYDTLFYPVLLAFPPGNQSKDQVMWAIEKYYIKESIKRNWIVISPASPDTATFHTGNAPLLADFIDYLDTKFNPERNKYHLAGISNGGKSAFRTAIDHSDKFQSVTVFPGAPPQKQDYNNLDELDNMSVALFVGGQDSEYWRAAAEKTYHKLDSLGADVTLNLYPNDGHVINSITSELLFDLLDSYRD